MQWSKAYGTVAMEGARHGIQTSDDGFIAIGNHWSTTGNFIDYMVVKTDKNGQIQWQKALGGSQQEYGYAIAQTKDEGFVLVGGANSNDGMVKVNKGLQDIWIVKLDVNGNLLWEKSFGGSSIEQGETVLATSDGGFILGGYTSSTNGDVVGNDGITDVWIVKFDASGSISWQKCFGGSLLEIVNDITSTNDGGYIFTGYSRSSDGDLQTNKGGSDLWIVKLDSQGNIQWQKTYGGSQFDSGEDINPTHDGGYIITGMTESNDGDVTGNHGLLDFWVIKVNATGNLEWQQCYGGSGDDFGAGGFQAADKTYYISGHARSTDGQITGNKGYGDSWVLNLDATGKILWQKNYGGSGQDITSAMIPTSDGWFATIGSTTSNNGDISGLNGSDDFWIMKFGPDTKCLPMIKINASTNSICMGTSISFAAAISNGGSNPVYKWKVNNIVTGENATTFSATTFRQGDQVSCEYSCRTACGKDTVITSNVIIIDVINDIQANVAITADKHEVCAGEEVSFTANAQHGSLHPTYTWVVDGITYNVNNTTFKTTLSTNASVTCLMQLTTPACPDIIKQVSNEIDVIAHQIKSPEITIAASADTICQGETVTFAANSNAGSNASYVWKVNGTAVPGSGAIFSSSSLQDNDVVSCNLMLLPAARCFTSRGAVSNDVLVHVKNIPAPALQVQAINAIGCKGEKLAFAAHPSNAGSITQYQWKVNGNTVSSSTSSFTSSLLEDGDKVSCVIQIQNSSCPATTAIASNVVTVQVKPAPLISFSPTEITIAVGKQVTLSPKVAGNPVSYTWTPAQLVNDPSGTSPTTLPLTVDKELWLAVTDANGCKATASIWVKVLHPLYMPNAFTPNGDGKNDVFRIPPRALLNLQEFSIFNSWGEVVFSTSDRAAGWNGTYKGEKQHGLFVYIIKGMDDKGPVLIKGTVVVIR